MVGWWLSWMIFKVSCNLDDSVILWKAWNRGENKTLLSLLINGKLLRYNYQLQVQIDCLLRQSIKVAGIILCLSLEIISKLKTWSGTSYPFAAVFVGMSLKGAELRPNSSVFRFYLVRCLCSSWGENLIIVSKNWILGFLHFSQSLEMQMSTDILLGAINSTRCQDM